MSTCTLSLYRNVDAFVAKKYGKYDKRLKDELKTCLLSTNKCYYQRYMVQNAAAIALFDKKHIKWGDIPTHLGMLLTYVKANQFILIGGPKWDELLSYKEIMNS